MEGVKDVVFKGFYNEKKFKKRYPSKNNAFLEEIRALIIRNEHVFFLRNKLKRLNFVLKTRMKFKFALEI